MLVEEKIFENAKSNPNKIALIVGDISISYAELKHQILIAAKFYQDYGLRKGDRVVVSASKCVNFVYAYLGAHMAGLICIPLDSETNATRLKRIEDCAQPKLFVGELRNKGSRTVLPFKELLADREAEVEMPDASDVADILFTTGTTGVPKGVSLSFLNLQAAVEQINTFIGNTAEDIELLALPISHSFGLGRLRCVLYKGGTLVLLGSFASMKKFYTEIERRHVTGFGMVPSSWNYIKKISGNKLADFASQLKYIEIGSAFMPENDKHKLMQMLPSTRICMHYGLTEASRSTFLSFHDDKDHLMSIGKPSPGRQLAIFNDKGEQLKPNQDGELCVCGPHVCAAYWGQGEEEFRKDFYGDYFRTGDWGYIDCDGYIYLKSRIKEIINVGGKKVSPIEVEEVLNLIDGITESACIGARDNVMGEVVKAFIVGSLTEADNEMIREFLTSHLENYKVPAIIEHVSELPKTANGKLQRLLLK